MADIRQLLAERENDFPASLLKAQELLIERIESETLRRISAEGVGISNPLFPRQG